MTNAGAVGAIGGHPKGWRGGGAPSVRCHGAWGVGKIMCSPEPETRGRSGSDHKLGNKNGFDSDGETGEPTAGAKENFQTQRPLSAIFLPRWFYWRVRGWIHSPKGRVSYQIWQGAGISPRPAHSQNEVELANKDIQIQRHLWWNQIWMNK